MRLYRTYHDLPDEARGAAVALGNFDGVHRGHQTVILEAARVARARGVKHGVVTFEPHPRAVLMPHIAPGRLSRLKDKARLIAALGVDNLYVLRFNEALSSMPARRFVTEVLVGGIGVAHVVVGHDFIFGHRRGGNAELLREMGREHGFAVTVVDPVVHDGTIYSSSEIRKALKRGDVRRAAELLGRPWQIEQRIVHGDKRGRTIGFPTANLRLGRYLQPATGVYAVRVGLIAPHGASAFEEPVTWYDGVANFGRRPTFDKTDTLLEVHLFDYSGDLYGRSVRVHFIDRIRDERRFEGIDDLKSQIEQDCARARVLIRQASDRRYS